MGVLDKHDVFTNMQCCVGLKVSFLIRNYYENKVVSRFYCPYFRLAKIFGHLDSCSVLQKKKKSRNPLPVSLFSKLKLLTWGQ